MSPIVFLWCKYTRSCWLYLKCYLYASKQAALVTLNTQGTPLSLSLLAFFLHNNSEMTTRFLLFESFKQIGFACISCIMRSFSPFSLFFLLPFLSCSLVFLSRQLFSAPCLLLQVIGCIATATGNVPKEASEIIIRIRNTTWGRHILLEPVVPLYLETYSLLSSLATEKLKPSCKGSYFIGIEEHLGV